MFNFFQRKQPKPIIQKILPKPKPLIDGTKNILCNYIQAEMLQNQPIIAFSIQPSKALNVKSWESLQYLNTQSQNNYKQLALKKTKQLVMDFNSFYQFPFHQSITQPITVNIYKFFLNAYNYYFPQARSPEDYDLSITSFNPKPLFIPNIMINRLQEVLQ